jgi:IMP dehydrogenase
MKNELISFDDVLIKPAYSNIRSRSEVSTLSHLGDSVALTTPVIAANMDTVCEYKMAVAMEHNGGIGILHRNLSPEERMRQFKLCVREGAEFTGVAIGVNENTLFITRKLLDIGVGSIVLDIAHGHSDHAGSAIAGMRAIVDSGGYEASIVAGNVATAAGVEFLAKRGADIVKVGIGPGAVCTTRAQTGVGVPQLSAIMECSKAADACGVFIIADGGIKSVGDICKALAAGADAVMVGSMLSGCAEAPGKTSTGDDGRLYKEFRGMASAGAGSSYVEGAEGMVPCDTTVDEVMSGVRNGLKSSMSYVGARTLSEFRLYADFVRVSASSTGENGAHAYS